MELNQQMEALLEKCFLVAKNSGVPVDQARRLVESGYIPYPWQWRFHAAAREADRPNGPVQIGCGGSRGPGKSHAIFSQITLDDLQRVPNLKGLFLRQTGKAAKESFEDLVARVLSNKVQYEYGNSVLRFSNGSKAILGGFKDDRDIDKYVGIEYDIIGVEEGNQLSGEKKEMLRGSLRTSKDNWRPRWYESFNPGGIGHGEVKTKYILPYRLGLEKETRFIPATYKDNPNLNKEYIEYLESLEGQLGKAWREGNFDILAGQYFIEWSEKIHVVAPFEIPLDWRRFCALDYGLVTSSLGWYAVSPEEQVYRYRELYKPNLTYTQLAEEFVSMTPSNEKIEYIAADPSIWNRDGRSEEAISGAEIFERRVRELTANSQNRCPRLERGNNDRVVGWGVVREYLRPYQSKDPSTGKEYLTAKLQVFDTCPSLIRTMPLQVHDEHNPEDIDTDLEDHAPDELRYGMMSKPTPSKTVEEIAKKEFKEMIKRRNKGASKGKRLFT